MTVEVTAVEHNAITRGTVPSQRATLAPPTPERTSASTRPSSAQLPVVGRVDRLSLVCWTHEKPPGIREIVLEQVFDPPRTPLLVKSRGFCEISLLVLWRARRRFWDRLCYRRGPGSVAGGRCCSKIVSPQHSGALGENIHSCGKESVRASGNGGWFGVYVVWRSGCSGHQDDLSLCVSLLDERERRSGFAERSYVCDVWVEVSVGH